MWYLKYRFAHSDCIYAYRLKKHNLSGFFFPLNHFYKDKQVYTHAIIHLIGEDNNINGFFLDLKKDKHVVRIEKSGSLIFILASHSISMKVYEAVYNPLFIFVTPGHLDKDGFEVFELACWDRKPLEELINSLKNSKTTTHFEIVKFVNKEIDNLFVTRLLPGLPLKQSQALRLAYKHGYYSFPRKVDLDVLAGLAGVSKATFRENLRKAEAKILPLLSDEQ